MSGEQGTVFVLLNLSTIRVAKFLFIDIQITTIYILYTKLKAFTDVVSIVFIAGSCQVSFQIPFIRGNIT